METQPIHTVKLWAFFLSLILSPLLIVGASLGFFLLTNSDRIGLLIAASLSLVLLSAPYVIVGWPALYFASKRRAPSALYWGIVGLIANLFAPFVTFLINSAIANRMDMLVFRTSFEIGYTLGFAAMFIWCAFAAILYKIFAPKQKTPKGA